MAVKGLSEENEQLWYILQMLLIGKHSYQPGIYTYLLFYESLKKKKREKEKFYLSTKKKWAKDVV